MGDGGHPLRQARSTEEALRRGVILQRLAAGEHQHDDRAGQVFAQQHGGDDGDARQQIGAEFPMQKFFGSS